MKTRVQKVKARIAEIEGVKIGPLRSSKTHQLIVDGTTKLNILVLDSLICVVINAFVTTLTT